MAASYEEARRIARSRLGAESLEHSERVAETAAQLAAGYGLDSDAARLGGLLHDWARDLPSEELMSEARRFGIEVTPLDSQVPYLLHAKVGAARAAEDFPGLSSEVLRTVAAHTLGSDSMSGLEMVVYVADMIEPGRDFPGVDALREAVGTVGLEELFAAAYQQTMRFLIETRRHIHPGTVSVWNSHVAGD